MTEEKPSDSNTPSSTPWFSRLGPALITACVVIGPGSILTSSNVGAVNGYGLSWVVAVAVVFMLTYMSMGARLGVSIKQSAGTLVAERIGRWFAILIGISVFFISAAFQFGNNLGVHYAIATYIDFDYAVVIFNALAIGFLLFFKNMYKALEKLMMIFVGVMLVAFLVNLLMAGPRFGEWAQGFVPGAAGKFDLSVLGLVGTTFVTTAAFYQAYLVRQKGLTAKEVQHGMIDVRIGATVMAAITLMLMATPATLYYPIFQYQQVVTSDNDAGLPPGTSLVIDESDPNFTEHRQRAESEMNWKVDEKTNKREPRWTKIVEKAEFEKKYQEPYGIKTAPRSFRDLPEVGTGLKPFFGTIGPPLFFLGVFAAAYSSFLVNSMIGGFILADGLGIGAKPEDKWPKIFTIAVLLTGMFVGLYVITVMKLQRPVTLIVMAQAVTVIASPIIAGTLLWMSSSKDIMGENKNGPVTLTLGVIGFVLLLAMSARTATSVVPKIMAMFS